MTEWVAVSVNLVHDPKVRAFAVALGVDRDSAVVRLLQVWSALASHEFESGNVSEVADETLEEWAGWRGKSGRFAAAFRHHFVSQSVVNGWWEWNGRHLQRARLAREHMRAQRDKKCAERRGSVSKPLANSSLTVSSQLDGNTVQYSTVPTNTPQEVPAVWSKIVQRMTREPDRWAVVEFLEDPRCQNPEGWVGPLTACLEGLDMPGGKPATPEAVAATCRDFVTKNMHEWTPKFFRTCVAAFQRDAQRVKRDGVQEFLDAG